MNTCCLELVIMILKVLFVPLGMSLGFIITPISLFIFFVFYFALQIRIEVSMFGSVVYFSYDLVYAQTGFASFLMWLLHCGIWYARVPSTRIK